MAGAVRQALLLVNRRSRQGGQAIEPVAASLRDRGLKVYERVVEVPELIPRIIRAHPDCDSVIIAGGDGSFNTALPVLLRSGQRLGILPAGTANNLALTLGIPGNWLEAARIIADGRLHPIDVGLVNDVPFFTLASIGLSTEITRHLSHSGKGRLGLLAYLGATWKTLGSFRPFHAEIRHGNSLARVRTIHLAAGNGRFFGTRLKVAPDSAIDDQSLYLYSIEPTGLYRLLRLGLKMKRGTHVREPEVLVLRGRQFEVTTRPRLPVNTDGEITTRTPAQFRVLPGAVRVYVPNEYRSSAREEAGDTSYRDPNPPQ